MKFSCKFTGGPYDGRMADASVEEFKIGSILLFAGEGYLIADGPAARLFEKNQEGSEFLMCNMIYVPKKV